MVRNGSTQKADRHRRSIIDRTWLESLNYLLKDDTDIQKEIEAGIQFGLDDNTM